MEHIYILHITVKCGILDSCDIAASIFSECAIYYFVGNKIFV